MGGRNAPDRTAPAFVAWGLPAVTFLVAAAVPCLAAVTTAPATAPSVQVIESSNPPTVGTEGRIDVVVPFDDIVPVVAGSKTAVVVRVAERRQWGTGWRYDIRWVAAVPGTHDLIKAIRRDGQPDTPLALAPLLVRATSVLPESHDGSLKDVNNSHVGGPRWYWPVAIALAAAWALLLLPLIRSKLRRKPAPPAPPAAKPPTLGERLRPLVAAAAKGELDTDGQGLLERLLLHVWRRRLGLEHLPVTQALVQMKAHAEAGQILRAMEDWLHRPPSSRRVDEAELAKLLAPYADIPDVAEPDAEPATWEVR